jgi:peptidoglycan-associated lipoprotein|tara:strand:- start:146 stop:640 length:495 start_codon:yes stop_codon:yes gene_type:complete
MKFQNKLPYLLLAAFTLASCKTQDRYAGVDGDFINGVPLPDRQDGASFLGGNVTKGNFQPVQFGYDSDKVADSEMGKVEAVALAMRRSSADLIIAGFTDQRGTEEYNRGLGEQRALAVRQALIAQGISGGRIQTVSFGEELPADPSGSESAAAVNRRAEFGVIR